MMVILILPVLFAASVMGKTAGIIMSTICSAGILAYGVLYQDWSFMQALESGLIMISIMYIVGWFSGVLIDNNKKYQAQLEETIESLRAEMGRREAAEQKNLMLSNTVEQIPCIVMILAPDGRVEYVNTKFTQVTGYTKDRIEGKVLKSGGKSPQEFRCIWDIVSNGGIWQEEFRNRKADGQEYWEAATMSPFRNADGDITHVIKIAEDVTERKTMEKEMERLERLHLVGEMAAGIGHEIRNPMTTVRGFLQMLGDKEDLAKYSSYFNLMLEELDRANLIISEYLSLARNRAVEFQKQNLKDLVETLSPLLMADAMNMNKEIIFELSTVPDLLLDEKEMRQLLLNLVRNGLEAMNEGGVLTVAVTSENGGDTVILSVRDLGHGIAPEVLNKIGLPFFTTKESGTGLGLSVCYSIAARHEAAIKIKTDSSGTTFSVIFRQGEKMMNTGQTDQIFAKKNIAGDF